MKYASWICWFIAALTLAMAVLMFNLSLPTALTMFLNSVTFVLNGFAFHFNAKTSEILKRQRERMDQ